MVTCEERAGIHCININKTWPVTRGGLWTPFSKKLLSLLHDPVFRWFKLVLWKRNSAWRNRANTTNRFYNHWWNKYSGIPLYELSLDKDTRISRTVSLVPTESSYIFSFKRKRVKRTLGHAPLCPYTVLTGHWRSLRWNNIQTRFFFKV